VEYFKAVVLRKTDGLKRVIVTYYLVNTAHTQIVICQGIILPKYFPLFPALRQCNSGHCFKDDREVETVMIRWVIT